MDFECKEWQWYPIHRERWSALISRGWRFRKPPAIYNRVGITIFKDDDEYTMYVALMTPEEAHEELLERCECHAANYESRLS